MEVRLRLLIPFALFFLTIHLLPVVCSEDAHILFRYARNLATGQGIVYNSTPVEGATEFLWMIVLAIVNIAGGNVPHLAPILGLACVGWMIYAIGSSGGWERIGAASVLAVSPLVAHALAGYGTPLFALFAFLMFKAWRTGNYRMFHIYAALLALSRIEGVFLWAFVMGVDWYKRRRIMPGWAFLILPFAAYMVFRLLYFGYPFPNTFYVKATAGIDSGMLLSVGYFLVVLGVIVFGMKEHERWRIIPLALFALLYLMIIPADNIGDRFQFSILPAALLMFRVRPLLVAPLFVLCVNVTQAAKILPDERETIGRNLSILGRGVRLATTEAGWLPYYSDATTLDVMGLNDVGLAHGELTVKRLEEFDPDIIAFRTFDLHDKAKYHPMRAWNERENLLYTFCFTHGYGIAAIYGTGGMHGYTWYFVKLNTTRRISLAVISSDYSSVMKAEAK